MVRPLDDESDSDVAVSRATEIQQAINTTSNRVLAVIGHLNSGQTLAAMEVYKDLPLVVISATASEQSLTARNYDNFFRVNANDDAQATVSADFLTGKLQAKSVAVLYNNTEYGRGFTTSLADSLALQRGANVALETEVEEGQSTYTEGGSGADQERQIRMPSSTPAMRSRRPICVRRWSKSGVDAPMLASDGAFLAATIDESNGAAEGMYVNAFAPSPRNVADSNWVEAYQVVEYRNPETYSVNGYVAMQVLAEAVRKADSLERAAVASSLRSNSFDTLLDSLRFEPDGDLVDPQIWIYQVVDNEFQQVASE